MIKHRVISIIIGSFCFIALLIMFSGYLYAPANMDRSGFVAMGLFCVYLCGVFFLAAIYKKERDIHPALLAWPVLPFLAIGLGIWFLVEAREKVTDAKCKM